MLLLPSSDQRQGGTAATPSPEALIEEARHRGRRRRARLLGTLVVLAAVALGAYALLGSGGPGVIKGSADSPFANVRAFSGQGELAFVSRDQLWVLDGAGGALRHLRVPAGYEAAAPTFSHDGRWLAYVVRPTNTDYFGPFRLWIARADGTGAHWVAGVRPDQLVGWSPRADVLAVTAGQQRKNVPYGSPTALQLVFPRGGTRTLVDLASIRPRTRRDFDAVGGATWSPSGRALAVVLQAGGLGSEIETVPAGGSGKPAVWFDSGGGPVHIAGMGGRVPTELIPEMAGWWAHWGIAFWVIDGGGVDNRDNTPLAVIPRPGARPRYLTQTLSLGITDEVSPGPAGKLALVTSSPAGGRAFAMGKSVEICAAGADTCRPVPAATTWSGPVRRICTLRCIPKPTPAGRSGSGVSEDPSWSPSGGELAYVKAPSQNNWAWPSDAWFADHAVYVWNARTGATLRIGKVNGSALPTWSGNGKDLMYESGDGLWLMPLATGKPVEIAHPLYAQTEWNSKGSHLSSISYYGQIPWQSQFSWWSPSR